MGNRRLVRVESDSARSLCWQLRLTQIVAAVGLVTLVGCGADADREPSSVATQQELAQAGAGVAEAGDHQRRAHHDHPHDWDHCAPSCGNHVLDSGEACDDGNTQAGDGCSASCQLDDDTATPGDDRPGYVSCSDPTTQVSTTCGPGLGCCTHAGPSCAANGTECEAGQPFFDSCDGPEDCTATGLPCWRGRFGTICSVPSGGVGVLCHTDADCASERPVCNNGGCVEAVSTTP